MKKSIILVGIFLIFIIFITIIGSLIVTGNTAITNNEDILLIQSNKEVYFDVYGYSIDNPNIIVNPYGNSPLTALVMFETEQYSEVNITIISKDGASDISCVFEKNKYHMIPIYGLYANYNNKIIIESEGKENIIYINTSELPGDFIKLDLLSDSDDNFMFYNSNYPYAVDSSGEVRWYLNSNYYGNITIMDNSNIFIGSDRYNEEGNSISFYRMNLLGKIYSEYLLEDSYYGYSALYNDNLLVLSDEILLIDIQTGKVIDKYISNDNYDYLGVYKDNVIVRKQDAFYEIDGDILKELLYEVPKNNYSFYNSADNYKIIPSSRFGNLGITSVSKENIAIINYNKSELDNIEIIKDLDRIKVKNINSENIYFILDKFMDKKIYEVDDIKYINFNGLSGKYTIYYKIGKKIYKTNYYIEV